MGIFGSREPELVPSSKQEHERLFRFVQEAKLCGRLVPPPLIREFTHEEIRAIQHPPDSAWKRHHIDSPSISFEFPATWEVLDPLADGPRTTVTVRTGFKVQASHIFCQCELSITVVALSKELSKPDAYMNEVRQAAIATRPDVSSPEQKILLRSQNAQATLLENTYYQDDNHTTVVSDAHFVLPNMQYAVSVLAFFANADGIARVRISPAAFLPDTLSILKIS